MRRWSESTNGSPQRLKAPVKTDRATDHVALPRNRLSAPGVESHDRRRLRQSLCVVFVW